jgi:hypothetical protein
VAVSQVPTPPQSTTPLLSALLWSAFTLPNQANVLLQRISAHDGPPAKKGNMVTAE